MSKVVKIRRKEWKALLRLSNTLNLIAGNAHDMADVGTLLTRIRNDFDLMEAGSDYPYLAGEGAHTIAHSLDRMTQTLIHATGDLHDLMHLAEKGAGGKVGKVGKGIERTLELLYHMGG